MSIATIILLLITKSPFFNRFICDVIEVITSVIVSSIVTILISKKTKISDYVIWFIVTLFGGYIISLLIDPICFTGIV